jgi:ABC-type Fe3+ transport system permease subunit
LVALAALLIGLVLTGDERLLYPLALASTLGVVVTLTSANTVVVLITIRRENTAYRWRDAAVPLLVALAFSLGIIMGIGAGRAALTDALHLPF